MLVIRNPLRTKNRSTPRKPPGRRFGAADGTRYEPAWKSTTESTATPRSPSRRTSRLDIDAKGAPGECDEVVRSESDRALGETAPEGSLACPHHPASGSGQCTNGALAAGGPGDARVAVVRAPVHGEAGQLGGPRRHRRLEVVLTRAAVEGDRLAVVEGGLDRVDLLPPSGAGRLGPVRGSAGGGHLAEEVGLVLGAREQADDQGVGAARARAHEDLGRGLDGQRPRMLGIAEPCEVLRGQVALRAVDDSPVGPAGLEEAAGGELEGAAVGPRRPGRRRG